MEVTEVPVPPLEKTGGGTGWGSALALRRNPLQVFWTRTYGLVPLPWSRFDLETGERRTARGRAGVHGDLRDAIVDVDGHHAWFLLTHGLARVDLDEMRAIEAIRRILEIATIDVLGSTTRLLARGS